MPIPDETREPMTPLRLVQEKQARPVGRHLPLGLSVVAVIAVTIAGFLVSSSPAWTSVDLAIVNAVGGTQTGFADGIAVGINWVFGPPMAVLITLLVAASVLAFSRRLVTTVWFVFLVAVPWLGSDVIKLLVHRVRPNFPALVHPIIATPTSWSFPSGHTAFAASLSLALIVILWKSRWHRLTVVAGVVLGLTVAVSRVYLGVHYPTDVLASLVYSVAAVTIVNSAWAGLIAPRWSR
ncbi:phosphatase PAP2 family protein [Cryobacterium zhongshanensis]|uniref:Phosphatase PAP2 family protein n=1 Tax=Cryobacterium zhongshanensis TaxID=2928153 RepID=A0AA41R150_9MICO|nr:phosphatase PAP2 family protein [Cryobacterium zhongshanensis]MCI4660073.1 phosphatase PAP2 family protein [Cryobacterium zhongshanensis]